MGDMSLPADYPTVPSGVYDEIKLVKLAREIARGMKDIPDILADNSITQDEFDKIQQLPYFSKVLVSEIADWSAAGNTVERIKLKSGTMLEEYMPEMYARLNDPNEPLMAKVKLVEVTAKWAGLGDRDIQPTGTPGDKVQVIINLGADQQLEFRKQLPPKVTGPIIENDYALQQNLNASPNQV